MRSIWILLLLAAAGCGSGEKQMPAEETNKEVANIVTLTVEQYKNAGLQTGNITGRNMAAVLNVNGKIDVPPQNLVSVSFPLGGYLRSTKLLPGAHVTKGEVIAVMEDRQYIELQQDYLAAKARHTYLENEYIRQRELNKSKASSDKVYQQAEAEYNSNRILIGALEQKLKLIGVNTTQLNESNISRAVNVYAPLTGFVSSVNVNIGRYVTPSDVIFELVDPTDIHLLLTVFERDISKLFAGQKVLAYTNNDTVRKYPAEIVLIGRNIGPDRTVQVHCHFDSYDKALIPGMYMNAEILFNEREALTVPADAVVRYGNKQYIFVAQGNNSFEMTEVRADITGEGYTAITPVDGLSMDKPVATTGAYTLLMMLKNKAD